jgi:ornithine carbamoyltransferase
LNGWGGHALFLGPNDIGIGKREAIKDISRLFSRYNDVVMARLFDHDHILELAKYSDIPVINGLTDYNHPCQIMADVMTIWEHRKNLDNLKITYMGDGNNIVHSWLQMATRIPMHFVCCSPSGFEPDQKTVKMIEDSGISTYELSHNPTDAVEGADVIYTDVWASMGQKDEAAERQKVFSDYQVNDSLMDKTGKETLFMHCLPAERGREVTDSVMESEFSIVFDEAENRMHAQNAIMVYLKNN